MLYAAPAPRRARHDLVDATAAQPAAPHHGRDRARARRIGLIYAWPIDSLVTVLAPITDILASVGLTMDRELAYLCLFACPSLLVVGSLLPGI